MKDEVQRVHLLPGLDAREREQDHRQTMVTSPAAEKNNVAAKRTTVLGTIFAVLAIATFLLFVLYLESIPGRTFDGSTMAPPEIIQEGLIQKVWISLESGKYYANVQFCSGTKRHRKCTLSTTGLYIADHPEAIIGKIPNTDWSEWAYMAMDVGLPATDYWVLRRAGWPLLGDRFIKLAVLQTDN